MQIKWNFFVIAISLWFACVEGEDRYDKIRKELKQVSRKARPFRGEKESNCSCPFDAPVDDFHEYCGYEIKNKTSSKNLCKDQTKYRCMDPYPWMAIELKDCNNLRGEKKRSSLFITAAVIQMVKHHEAETAFFHKINASCFPISIRRK
jgi:hypothetical protein